MPAARYWRAIDLESHGGGELELSALHLYSGSAADPDYANVSLLLHGDGSFVDTGPTPKTVTAVGNAQISTTQSKFGGSAMLFDGTGDYLSIPDSDDLSFGASPFTLEAWVRPTGYPKSAAGVYKSAVIAKDILNAREYGFTLIGTASSFTGIGFIGFSDDSAGYTTVDGSYAFNLNTWYHVAAVRSGNLIYLFVDGVMLIAGGTAFTRTIQNDSAPLLIGANNFDATYLYHFNGYIDDVRITKGVARYTANFTPPTAPFPNTATPGTQTRADATATLTSTYAPVSGTLANLQDTDLNTVTRFDTSAPRFALEWDFGVGNTADITTPVPGSSTAEAEFLSRCILQYSSDTYLWTTLNTFGQYVWPGANKMVEVSAPAGDPAGDPEFANVSLLLHGNGANASTVFTDSSATPKTVTAVGNAQISTTQSKFGGASMYFDGTGDFVTVPASTDFVFGTGDFTIEAWVYLPVTPSGSYAAIVDIRNAAVHSSSVLFVVDSSRTLGYWTISTPRTSNTIPLNTWTHVAISRSSGVTKLFVGGVEGASVSDTSDKTQNPIVYIGSTYDSANPAFNGYIDDLRITKGVARYTANFTPPTAELPGAVVAAGDEHYNSVSLLLHGDGANGSTVFTDNSPTPKTVTAVGGASIRTAQSKFGGSSMYFDGTGDYLTLTNDGAFNPGSGDFTVEGWMYPTSTDTTNIKIIATTRPTGSALGWTLYHSAVVGDVVQIGITAFSDASATTVNIASGTTTAPTGAWVHVAFAKQGAVWRVFVGGVLAVSATETATNGGSTVFTIGKDLINAARDFNGYIDDLRITKGVARYTANFTPPASAFGNSLPTGATFEALPRPILNDQQFVSWPGASLTYGTVGAAPNDWVTAYDPYHGGVGRIVGTVKEKHLPDNVPLGRKVWLMDEASKMVIRETWSDVTTGDYEFTGIRMGTKYAVFAYDYTGAYRAVIADNQEATL